MQSVDAGLQPAHVDRPEQDLYVRSLVAALDHELQQLLDVAVVGPPGRGPGRHAGVRKLA